MISLRQGKGPEDGATSPCKGEVDREAGGRGFLAPRFTRTHPMTARGLRLRKEPSEAEKKLWRLVRRQQLAGLGFRRQHAIGSYVLDFYCPALKLAVELDGGQHAEAAQAAHDRRRTRWLSESGIKVLRFWNNDVLGNIEGVLTVLMQEIDHRPDTPSLSLPLARGGESQEPQAPNLARGQQ